MSPSEIPKSRSLVVIDAQSVISPDAKRRVLKQYFEKKEKYKYLNYMLQLSPFVMLLSFLIMIIGIVTFQLFVIIGISMLIPTFVYWKYLDEEALNNKNRLEIKTIEFPCPYCSKLSNLCSIWICGNCKKQNNDDEEEFAIPFYACEEAVCSTPEQTAYQCPHCHHHIVLDKERYVETRSHEHPYRGVARFAGDFAEPIVETTNKRGSDSRSKFFE